MANEKWETEGFISKTSNPDWFKVDIDGKKVGLIRRGWLNNLLNNIKEAAPIKAPPENESKNS